MYIYVIQRRESKEIVFVSTDELKALREYAILQSESDYAEFHILKLEADKYDSSLEQFIME